MMPARISTISSTNSQSEKYAGTVHIPAKIQKKPLIEELNTVVAAEVEVDDIAIAVRLDDCASASPVRDGAVVV